MSLCINRQLGDINGKLMCRDLKKLGPCPWWRAMFCIPWDLVLAIGRGIKNLFAAKGT